MREIIIHAKKSCLYKDKEPWGKRSCSDMFDVTMGSFDGAETCELVGTFILNEITQKHGEGFGLYRDDGLGVTTASPREVERIKKDLCLIFKKHGLKITIDANKKTVNFLDITLSLSGKHEPYNKPNNTPLYVHAKSNHPPGIIKNIPEAVNKRLSHLSCDEEAFNRVAPIYQSALERSGYKHQLKYSEAQQSGRTDRRVRKRNIIWYNPPYSRNVATNIGQIFLKILDDEFPTDHVLHKIFNRNTIKIGYCCMGNMKSKIDGHNQSVMSARPTKEEKTCNCRRPDECPVSGRCLVPAVIYQATVKTSDAREDQTYVGLTENSFKTRYTNHKASFNNADLRKSTELSKYIWSLKERNINFKILWTILKQAAPYNPGTNRCNLCLWEKFYIICKPDCSSLNKRNELVSTCRHSSKFLLRNHRN